MRGAGGAGSDERAAAPILPLWMEEPSVRAHPSREWPAPLCAQVKMTYSSILFNIFRWSRYTLEYQEISQMGHFAGSTRVNFKTLKTSDAAFLLCSSTWGWASDKTRLFKCVQLKNNYIQPGQNRIWPCYYYDFVMKNHLHQEHSVIWFTVTHHSATYCFALCVRPPWLQNHFKKTIECILQIAKSCTSSHCICIMPHYNVMSSSPLSEVISRCLTVKWLTYLLSHSSGWRLDRVGKVVRLWDRVHPLAQSRVPSPPTQERRKALQRQHDGEQKLHRGAVCAQ